MIRLFFGLELPPDLRARIAAIAPRIDRARPVAPEDLHITLRFVGEVDPPAMREAASAAGRVRFDPLEVTLAGAGHFESRRRVHALWLGVSPNSALHALRDRLEAAMVRAGLPPERRRYHPHVTVARLSRSRPEEVGPWLAANTMFRAVPFTATRFVLYSSAVGGEGPRYRIEAGYPSEDRPR